MIIIDDPLTRPIGWWLKEADARIDAAFDAALADTGTDRRRWQVLSSLAHGPAKQEDLAAALSDFDDATVLEPLANDLVERGWVERVQDQLRLTSDEPRRRASFRFASAASATG